MLPCLHALLTDTAMQANLDEEQARLAEQATDRRHQETERARRLSRYDNANGLLGLGSSEAESYKDAGLSDRSQATGSVVVGPASKWSKHTKPEATSEQASSEQATSEQASSDDEYFAGYMIMPDKRPYG